MLDKIPAHIKNKVQDIDWTKTFIFEEMPQHQHTNRAEEVDCKNCPKKIIEREEWLENYLLNQDPNESIKDIQGNIVGTLKKITVVRGRYDDCIGIIKE